jgi:CHASE3 domain sensor protein
MNPPTPAPAARHDKTIWRILAFFLVISAIVLIVAVASVRNINRAVESSDWVNHTHAVMLEVNGVFSSLQAGNGAALTYLATGDARNQAAGRAAFSDLAEHLEVAKALTRQESSQHQQVINLEELANRRAEFDRSLLASHPIEQPGAARALVGADGGAEAMGEIQRLVEKLTEQEMGLLADRDRASYLQAQTTRWTVWSGVVLDVLLLGGAAWLISDDIAARRRAAVLLEEANDLLETKVRERTAELAAANEGLTTENLERRWVNQALEHQLRYDQLIISSISDLVLVLTKAMNISRMNPAVVRVTGREPQDLVHRPFSVLARLTDRTGETPLVDPMAQALRDGQDLREQTALLEDKLGRKIPVRLALFPLRDRDKVVGGVVILQIIPQSGPPAS